MGGYYRFNRGVIEIAGLMGKSKSYRGLDKEIVRNWRGEFGRESINWGDMHTILWQQER